jgi:DNA-binding transcriptional LysR family regulator
VLLAVARCESFLAAGQSLGMSTSTVARRVTLLEERIGTRLVRRAASGATLEPAASALVDLAERIEAELAVRTRDARSVNHAGVVRVSLGEGFVRFVTHAVATFRRDHPETEFELVIEQRMADLPKREADVALRTSKSTSADVVSRKLGELRYGLFATDEYLRGARIPTAVKDLSRHAFVGYEGVLSRQPEMQWLRDRGAKRFPVRATHTEGLLEACAAHQGIAALPLLLASTVPALRRVDVREELPSKTIFVAMHRDMRAVPRVRAFADLLAAESARALSARPRASH